MGEYEIQNLETHEVFLIFGYSYANALKRHNLDKNKYRCLAYYKEDEE
jgi:hypothetical protein